MCQPWSRDRALKEDEGGFDRGFLQTVQAGNRIFFKKCSEQKIAAALWESMKDEGGSMNCSGVSVSAGFWLLSDFGSHRQPVREG